LNPEPAVYDSSAFIATLQIAVAKFNIKRTIWLKGYQNGNHMVTLKPDNMLNVKYEILWLRNNIITTSQKQKDCKIVGKCETYAKIMDKS